MGAGVACGAAASYVAAVVLGHAVQEATTPLDLAWPAIGVAGAWLLAVTGGLARWSALGWMLVSGGVVLQRLGHEPAPAWTTAAATVAAGLAVAETLRARGWRRIRAARSLPDLGDLALASVASAVASAVVALVVGGVLLAADATPPMIGTERGSGLVEFAGVTALRHGLCAFLSVSGLLALPELVDRVGRARRWVPIAGAAAAAIVVAALMVAAPPELAFAGVVLLVVVGLRSSPAVTAVTILFVALADMVSLLTGAFVFPPGAAPGWGPISLQVAGFAAGAGALVVAVTLQDRADALQASRRDRDRLHDHMEAALVAAAHLELDARGRVRCTEVNRALADLTSSERERLVGDDPLDWFVEADGGTLTAAIADLVAGAAGWRGPLRLTQGYGGGWVDAALVLVDRERDPATGREVVLLKLQMIDITAQREAERQLARVALHDDLTGLANRVLWTDRLGRALRAATDASREVAVLYVDLDHFKQINDAYGHDVGDQVLRHVGARLRSVVGPHATIGRLGGDEFVVLHVAPAHEERSGESALALADQIHQSLRTPMVVGTRLLMVTASVGVGVAEAGDLDGRPLMRRADAALYTAKAAGRARAALHGAHRADAPPSVEVLLDLEQAQRRDELVVHYQPIVDAFTGEPVAVEALLRWHHPRRGLLEPADFMEVLEGSELMHPVGARVLATACADGARMLGQGWTLDIHVNVSAEELARPGLARRVLALVERTGLPASLLVLEITETRLVAVTDALVHELDVMHRAGIRLAVDDFGTGYSTLTHLVELPIGLVKLDRRFVAEITASASARSVAHGVRAMAEGLRVEAVAEGVEDADQARALRDLGYQRLQGFHCGRPRPVDELLALLAEAEASREDGEVRASV